MKIKLFKNNLKLNVNKKFLREKLGLIMTPKQNCKLVHWTLLLMTTNQIRKNITEITGASKENSTNKMVLKTNKAVKKSLEKINRILNKRSEIELN